MHRTIPLALAAAAIAVTAAGCGTSHSRAAQATASHAVRQDKRIARSYTARCLPVSGTAQVNLIRSLTAGSRTSRTSARRHLGDCLGVPAAQRPAWEAAVLTAAEHVNWASGPARDRFFTVTLVTITEQHQGGAAL